MKQPVITFFPGEPQTRKGSTYRNTNKRFTLWCMVMSYLPADASVKLTRELLNSIPDILSSCEWSPSQPIPPITNIQYTSSDADTTTHKTRPKRLSPFFPVNVINKKDFLFQCFTI